MRTSWYLVTPCFNTQPPEGGWEEAANTLTLPKGFNTQPPEGGWMVGQEVRQAWRSFNTQPPEGGWSKRSYRNEVDDVSTHSRLKAAGILKHVVIDNEDVSTHSRLKAAGH